MHLICGKPTKEALLKLKSSDINRVFEMVDDNDIECFDTFFEEFKK